ncbi:transglutaminase TgpA family protein [Neobacillus terrae]|uniref:transglutaminase TgpA family protein n=1 Tax=Neobacillus terrae TaxID=3034837 RepID=UPI00140D196E|nr:transglutaminaseTgpA domain-containing protein [Neobacillus terrae]NHM33280.1 transglutaminase [Neobacillus terrae]
MRNQAGERGKTSMQLYAIAFFMLWEWLRPIGKVTETSYLGVFIVFIALSFAGGYFQINKGLKVTIKLLYILGSVYNFYYSGGFFHFNWWNLFFTDLSKNAGFIGSGDWTALSDPFRTILFFTLLWLMVYLLQYWLLNRQRIFVFFLMTIIYITVLDTFTPYNAKWAIVRTVLAGFTVMGILTFSRIINKENVGKDSTSRRKWMIPLAVMLFLSGFVGMIAPKAAPVWPDPVPFLTSLNNKSGDEGNSGGIARIGYGTNDSRLGGPFIPDNSVVFTANTESSHYWKVESKEVYTGKGWTSPRKEARELFNKDEEVPFGRFPGDIKTEKEKVELNMNLLYNHIVYPYGTVKINAGKNVSFEADPVLEKIYSYMPNREPYRATQYSMDVEVPEYKVSALRSITGDEQTVLSPEFMARYTQLPNSLPSRVKRLAQEITAGKENWWDKANAIEDYFDLPDFTYDQKKVAVPGKKDDYVDQFLFKTKRGYCDNFSSSMTVMLRTLGIPARWVKGYAQGEFQKYDSENSNRQVFEVTNNNAHSWVEVYFPGQGWIPFEPTKGFDNSIKLNYEINSHSTNKSEAAPVTIQKKTPKNRLEEMEKNTVKSKAVKKEETALKKATVFIQMQWLKVLLGFLAIGILAYLLYNIRYRWLPHYFIFLFKWRKNDTQFAKAYMVLLKQLERYGLKRRDDQTLRSYAKYVDSFFTSNEMGRLTNRYEQMIYNNSLPKGSWNENRELWENLIKKTIA